MCYTEFDIKNMSNEDSNKSDLEVAPGVYDQSLPAEPLSVVSSIVDSKPPDPSRKKQSVLVGLALFAIVFLVGGLGLFFLRSYQTNIKNNTDNFSVLDPSSPKLSSTPPIQKEELSVQYSKREKILETVKIPRNNAFGLDSTYDFDIYVYDFYKIGTITSGKYQGGELILGLVVFDGPCKSASCSRPLHFRYIKNEDTVTYLPNISNPISFIADDDSLLKANPFQKFGMSLATDNEVTIPVLEYPEEIVDNPRQVLKAPKYQREDEGELDTAKLYKVFSHSVLGDIYTTKPEFSPSKSFGGEDEGGLSARDTLEGCRGSTCFTTNAFFAFRPDGTFLKFAYSPDFSTNDIIWTDNKSVGNEYLYNTVVGCSRDKLDSISVVSPSLVSETDLVVVGKVKNTGDYIYGLKDQNHKLYSEFYNSYKEYYAGSYIYPEEKSQTKSFDDFINSRPIFLWRDPFNRLVRYNNEEFLPPYACEPIIYLYPQTTQKVSVKVGNVVNISDSIPNYRNGWNVIADPSGNILDITDNRTYPYLFWEGWSLIFPIQSKGFVVKQSEVAGLLSEVLPKLGLNEKEKVDFMEAWLPQFTNSPYFFITFLDKIAIDTIAPLQISPKPDTVIRILMDTKPLEHPVDVVELEFETVPERFGFTLVEWGGLKR